MFPLDGVIGCSDRQMGQIIWSLQSDMMIPPYRCSCWQMLWRFPASKECNQIPYWVDFARLPPPIFNFDTIQGEKGCKKIDCQRINSDAHSEIGIVM